MTQHEINDGFLSPEDLNSISAIENSRLNDLEKESIIADIKADAYRRSTAHQILNVAKRQTFSLDNLRTKPKPEGWEESRARVKAQLEESRLYAPIEGTNNSPFRAAEMREAAESKRVQDWKQRKELEIAALRQTRIEKEVASYHAATTALDKKAVLEGLSPEALARVVKR
jgi:hypothetical protein